MLIKSRVRRGKTYPFYPRHVRPRHEEASAQREADPAHESHLLAVIPAMLFTSRSDGAWDYVSPLLCDYAGYPEDALMGLGWAAVLHDEDRADSLARWQSAVRSGMPLMIEHRLRGADGTYRWFRMQCAPQRHMIGVITRWAGIVTPIEIERQAEAERALRHSAELTLDKHNGVIAIAAHELRAPLTVLLGQAQLLQRRFNAREDVDPRDRRSVDMLVDQSLRLAQLVSALLDATAIEHGQLRVSTTMLDLSALVDRVVLNLQPVLSTHTLRLNVVGEPLWVVGDALRLEQVLQNLLQNAVKYSPAGSEIVIEVAPQEHQVRIAIRDYGSGIAASARPSLFQRFFRAADEYATTGLGLGLYISKAIMDLHGGDIEVESAVGAGSTFTMRLPRIWPQDTPSERYDMAPGSRQQLLVHA
ncbi:PAS domain-containing sensor histidine kinase [Chloroflexales bacterium ZM16-3]|nr:PAS domain-containing sensor histidine kinase [Chloroflexales bacterium ZM16-3]